MPQDLSAERGVDPDGSGGPHVFVADLATPELTESDRHHLGRVVRLRDGDRMTIGDGKGSWRRARFGSTIEIDGDIIRVEAERDVITVAFALIKGSRTDDVTRHLVELGVDVIVPMVTDRSVVRWNASDVADRHARLTRIATEAAMQCRRSWLPTIQPLTRFATVVSNENAILAQMGAAPLPNDATMILIGPEGGWTEAEQGIASRCASLGDHVLRAETAALTAGALLSDRRRQRR